MEQSFTTLFGRPAPPSGGKKIVWGILALPFIFPLAVIAAISIPWTHIRRLRLHRSERKFAEQMGKANRLMAWREFRKAIENGKGTAIGEYLSIKGPFRLWWTTEDVQGTTPHKWPPKEWTDGWLDPEFQPFFKWCYLRYSNPEGGLARLVTVPEEQKRELLKTLADLRYVSINSFHPRQEVLREVRSR